MYYTLEGYQNICLFLFLEFKVLKGTHDFWGIYGKRSENLVPGFSSHLGH